MSTRRVKPLRKIAASFVVAPPSGTSTLTRLFPSLAEEAALREIGAFLGSVYRRDLMVRKRIGRVPSVLNQRTERKHALTAVTSSRWAGAITRAAEDQYQLGLRALAAEVSHLTTAIEALQSRLALPTGVAAVGQKSGYRSRREYRAKQVRLAVLQKRLAAAQARHQAGAPVVVVGGTRLWHTRANLAQAGMSEAAWRVRWGAARMFLTADGESGAPFGNQTIRVEGDGILVVKVPAALTDKYGRHLRLAVPVAFVLRGPEWADRAASRQAIRYDITFDSGKDRWYVRASWSYRNPAPIPPLATLQAGRTIGVDLNADHITAALIDPSGNPVGIPAIIPLDVAGLSAATRDGHLRQSITTLLDYAEQKQATAIAIENLNFQDARSTGRETMGRGRRGKRFRRTVAGIPTGKFRDRLSAMAANRGIHLIAVDPAYTSRWGAQHWAKPLQTRTSDQTVTRHQAAAVAIGRRAHGHRITRRPDGHRTQQRMSPPPRQADPVMKPTGAPRVRTGPPRRQPPRLTGPSGTIPMHYPQDRSGKHATTLPSRLKRTQKER